MANPFILALDWLKSKRNYSVETGMVDTKIILPEPVAASSEAIGLEIKKHYEGCHRIGSDGLVYTYLCPAGIPTIGWGCTYYANGKKVTMGDPPLRKDQADTLGLIIWNQFKTKVAGLLPLEAPDRDVEVFTSLAYNIGMGDPRRGIDGFETSTALSRYLKGDRAGAGQAIEWWNKGEGRVIKGLQRRRRCEHLVFKGMDVKDAIKAAEKAYP